MNVSPLYKELARKQVFTYGDVLPFVKSHDVASVYLNRMSKEGLIRKVRKNLYVAKDLSSGGDLANAYQIAGRINDSSFVSYHSAFEFYGFYNQVFNIIQVSSTHGFSSFEDEGLSYLCFKTDTLKQVEDIQGAKVTSVERTIIDSIDKLGKVMDVEELLQCLSLVRFVDEKKLLEMLEVYSKDILYRKAGYFLSLFKEEFHLSALFFEICKKRSKTRNVGKISNHESNKLEFVKEWGLYGYKSPLKIITENVGDIE